MASITHNNLQFAPRRLTGYRAAILLQFICKYTRDDCCTETADHSDCTLHSPVHTKAYNCHSFVINKTIMEDYGKATSSQKLLQIQQHLGL